MQSDIERRKNIYKCIKEILGTYNDLYYFNIWVYESIHC